MYQAPHKYIIHIHGFNSIVETDEKGAKLMERDINKIVSFASMVTERMAKKHSS